MLKQSSSDSNVIGIAPLAQDGRLAILVLFVSADVPTSLPGHPAKQEAEIFNLLFKFPEIATFTEIYHSL